jgi:small subunit ribosomal protein S12
MTTINQLLKTQKRLVKKSKVRSTALEGCPQKRGICVKITTMKPKKPNSAIRKIAKVRLSTGRRITVYIPGHGHNLQEYSSVLVRGGKIPDLPGVRYKMIRGVLDLSWKEKVHRTKSRSKYGIPKMKKNKTI